jgi:CRISPR/Cas system CSM-associated protein Csm3 (group 7 of RAMP superfamily)
MTARNPYDFVRFEGGTVRRAQRVRRDAIGGVHGAIEGSIVAETPVFFGHSEVLPQGKPRTSLANAKSERVIPGSTLKGLLRSVVETLAPGCVRVGDAVTAGSRSFTVPTVFRGCTELARLCPACRMFGFVSGRSHLAGHIIADDAVATVVVDHKPVWLVILSSPKPHHDAWYAPANNLLVGRKFYFHQPLIRTASGPIGNSKTQNLHIRPLGTGTTFRFSIRFRNLDRDELDLLLFALALEPTMRHKVGLGKPAGLGSTRIAVERVTTASPLAAFAVEPSALDVAGEALRSWMEPRLTRFAQAHAGPALDDLRRIWAWPPADVTYTYPSRDWFTRNPRAPMSHFREQN